MTASPCTNTCQMDPISGLCAGCQRTLAEIAAWSTADAAARQKIVAAVAKRRLAGQAADPNAAPADEDFLLCVGACMTDPDSGYCLGCGRPPLAPPVTSKPR
ncbi:MAG: DUF1289 domain-containing protein [Desulfobulbus sp.]|nr:DUF1289 domain-containing protein [Desulfobulbus sp.]